MEDYKHIELTEDETDEAILWGKQRKDRKIEAEELSKIENANREQLMLYTKEFSYDQMYGLALHRAAVLFENNVFRKPFVIDENNKLVFEQLCMYFSRDKKFEQFDGFSLDKGICLVGIPGVGKSWLMKIFSKNPRQGFYIRDCKQISLKYQDKEIGGTVIIDEYSVSIKAAVNDKDNFYKPKIGVCFSDLGTEDIKNHMGNKSNVMADILFARYKNGIIGDMTHGETNLTSDQLKEFYGARIHSRFSEMFNWVVLTGTDRRKD